MWSNRGNVKRRSYFSHQSDSYAMKRDATLCSSNTLPRGVRVCVCANTKTSTWMFFEACLILGNVETVLMSINC